MGSVPPIPVARPGSRVVIVGAGMPGSPMAIYLSRRGFGTRHDLNVALIEAAEAQAGVRSEFDRHGTHLRTGGADGPTITVTGPGGEEHHLAADVVVGADGAFSGRHSPIATIDTIDLHRDLR